ncbi:hypothetical protein ZIOFF_034495 [Zingiber officinale]|uniref:Cation/H+ exchanger transmembrane domain-containing protein n=1 Tax=Zingiber officinale TaxID=94328 RepID=A0A8J5L2I6_ZINOF|nr:hypothetical protein ZIOFF_034495 [Zingiber officinale]
MLLAEKAVAFEVEATQRVNDAELALQRAEKVISITNASDQQSLSFQNQLVNEEPHSMMDLSTLTIDNGTAERDKVLVGCDMTCNTSAYSAIAEFGVVFLLFNIGLELSVERLSSMKKYVFGLGSSQVLVTAAVVGLVLQERGESTSRHGRATFSMLLFQGLAVSREQGPAGSRDHGGCGQSRAGACGQPRARACGQPRAQAYGQPRARACGARPAASRKHGLAAPGLRPAASTGLRRPACRE